MEKKMHSFFFKYNLDMLLKDQEDTQIKSLIISRHEFIQ